jgi:hypothetical protein
MRPCSLHLVPTLTYPYRGDQTHNILVSSFALIQFKSHSLKFHCTNNPSDLDSTTQLGNVPAGPARGLDDGPHDVGRYTDRAAEDGEHEPAVDARGELPRRRGLPPSPPPPLLQ